MGRPGGSAKGAAAGGARAEGARVSPRVRARGLAARLAGRRADALALAAFALFFVCFFPQAVFGGKYLIAGDAFYYSMPLRATAWAALRGGTLPLWTPHVLSGFPLLAMPQLALGYPLTWGYALLAAHRAEQLYVLAPYLLAPAFTYAYAREVGRTRLASLLAGISFAYGGVMCGGISNSGMLTNSMMWLPLVLVAAERARRGRLSACLLGAALAYSMSVLNGHAQSFVYVGLIAAAYGLFLSLSAAPGGAERDERDRHDERDERDERDGREGQDARRAPVARAAATARHDSPPAWLSPSRWRPLAVVCGAAALAAGLAAFQLLETARAARRSTRGTPTFETLAEGSFRFADAVRALFAPLYAFADVTPYVAPPALILACVACAASLGRAGRGGRDARVLFWLAVAAVSFVLMLGGNTPLQRVVYRLPALNLFRVPSRHAFEWTFALAVLAAYGFDHLSARFAARRERASTQTGAAAGDARRVVLCLASLAAAALVGALWWRATGRPPAPGSGLDTGLPESAYLCWKLAFTLPLAASAWLAWRVRGGRWRAGALAACVLLGCFVEANAFVWRKWGGLGLDAERFAAVSGVTRALQRERPEAGRVYTRVDLFVEEFARAPRLEGPNLTALHGLHNVAGVEPLILDRYSRALGGVGPDSVTPRAGFAPNLSLFGPRSHVLDLLNTTHVVSFADLQTTPIPPVMRDGVRFARTDLRIVLRPGERAELDGAQFEADALAVVSSLSNAGAEGQGAEVARARVRTAGGGTRELPLRAGVETAEWAHERADVRPSIKHAPAPVFDTWPGDAANSFPAHNYAARLPLAVRARVASVEIENVSRAAWLTVSKASLADAATAASRPLGPPLAAKWERAYDADDTLVLRNLRAQPRAWLVAEAESVDGEEALRRIRGEGGAADFDPRRTALLEVTPDELPQLPGGALAPGSSARVVAYGPNALAVETDSPAAAVLVVSEIFYPGWEASVDGRAAPIHLTDYLLRGVALPAGRHSVEMCYRAPAARNGVALSALTLLALCVLTFLALRRRAL